MTPSGAPSFEPNGPAPQAIVASRYVRSASSWLVPLCVAAVTFAVFLPSLSNGFVEFDDRENLIENPHFRGLGAAQLAWMATTFHMAHYQPLSWLSLAVDYSIWGMNPFGYHLTSLILHVLAATVFYAIVLRVLQAAPAGALENRGPPGLPGFSLAARLGAGFAALLFSIHPLRVESVAWATERRDVLAGALFLLAVLAYLRGVQDGRRGWITGALALHVLSLLSKASGAMLPAVLLLLDVHPLRRLPPDPRGWWSPRARTVLLEKVPFAAVSLVVTFATVLAQRASGSLERVSDYGPAARIAVPLYGLAFYVWKSLLPFRLHPFYALPAHPSPLELRFILSGLAVAGLSLGFVILRRRWPAGLIAWIAYVALLLPVLGAVQFGVQIAADRFAYLACLGGASLAGAALTWALLGGSLHALVTGSLGEHARTPAPAAAPLSGYEAREIDPSRAGVAASWRRPLALAAGAIAVAMLALLGALCSAQTLVWRNTESLWKHAVRVDPGEAAVHNFLANEMRRQGRLDEALGEYAEAVRLDGSFPEARVNLGAALLQLGQTRAAIEHLAAASRLRQDPVAQTNWGLALAREGRLAEALPHWETALAIDPSLPDPRTMMARALLDLGRFEDAARRLGEGLAYGPPAPELVERLSSASDPGALRAASGLLTQACRLHPRSETACHGLARIRIREGRFAEAAALFVHVLRFHPRSSGVFQNLAILCRSASLHESARAALRAGLANLPDDAALTRMRETTEAELARRTALLPEWRREVLSGTASPDLQRETAAADLEAGELAAADREAAALLRARPEDPRVVWILFLAQRKAPEPRALLPAAAMHNEG